MSDEHLDRCYWHQCENGTMAFIPHCWGSVIEGPGGCTCDITGSALEQAQAARAEAERVVERVIEKRDARQEYIQTLINFSHRARDRIRELEAEVESLRAH